MNDDRETARLWRVNRTIHELVADRVGFKTQNINYALN